VTIGRRDTADGETEAPAVEGKDDEHDLGHHMPNGIALERDGSILIADIATGRLERMSPLGEYSDVCTEIDGSSLGLLNFVMLDSLQRIWITVTTRIEPWYRATNERPNDGYVAVVDKNGARIVADGFSGTNEIRFDATEEWLYVVESNARHVTRLRRSGSETFSTREIYGPDDLGGIPDGFAFDIAGNLWVTLVNADRLIAIAPDGETLTLLDDGNHALVAEFERHFSSRTVTPSVMSAARGTIAPMMSSVTFGGPDLRSVFLGSLMGTSIPTFVSPVPGLPLAHWGR
jgi:sugar lactone lactonase YvrE